MLLMPKLIMLDTNQLNELMRDALSSEHSARHRAFGFADSLLKRGYTLLFTYHHMEELTAHGDRQLVHRRIRFLSTLPLVSWISNFAEAPLPGGASDVMAAEVRAVVGGAATAEDVRDSAKANLLRAGLAASLFPGTTELIDAIADHSCSRVNKAKTITAVAPFKQIDPRTRLSEILRHPLRSVAERTAFLSMLRWKLTAEISKHGDAKISDPNVRASQFVGRVSNTLCQDYRTASEFHKYICNAVEIDEDDLPPDATMNDLCELATFRMRLKAIAPATGLSFEQLKGRVRKEQLPSQIVSDTISAHAQELERRPGSDLNDRLMLSVSPYSDITYVDKRTSENVRRALQKQSDLRALIGRVEKRISYRHVESALDDRQ